MNKQWYRVDHWGRFCDISVTAVDVIKKTEKTIWIESSSPVRRDKGQGDKASIETEDHTFVEGKKAAFDLAIDRASRYVAQAKSLMESGARNIKKLEAQEKKA